MTEAVLEVRAGNGPEATRQVSEEGHTVIKDQASKDSKARSISEKQDINSTGIWGEHYSKANSSLVNGENRRTV